MLSIITDSLNVATRRAPDRKTRTELEPNPWADRFVPTHERTDRYRTNVLRDLRWY